MKKHLAARLLVMSLGLACGPAFADTAPATAANTAPIAKISRITGVAADPNWAEEYAYTLGVQAYTYAFPWYYNTLLRWKSTTQPAPNDLTPSMPLNSFFHVRRLIDSSYRDGGSANNDTLYSIAWLELGKEPIILSVPEMGNRYYTVQFSGFDSDNFAYVGQRATGSHAGNYAIVGPGWKGKLPPGVKALKPAPTPTVLVVGRILINGAAEIGVVNRLQDQIKLTPLSLWGKKGVLAPDNRDAWAPYDRKADPMADWKTINRALGENPPPARDDALLKLFAKIGVGPGLDIDKVDEPTRRGLLRALASAKGVVTGAASDGAGGALHNGWRLYVDSWGHAGQTSDFIVRGGPQSLGGVVSNDHVEAMYPMVMHDKSGGRLTGAHKYVLRFAKDELPPVKAFWSMTAYGMDFNLIDNPTNRYSRGDRSPGLKRDADGGLTLYVQNEAPGSDKEANWLPVGTGEFFMILRLYLPKPEAVSKQWVPPALERLD